MFSRTRLPLAVLCLLTTTVVLPARLGGAPPGEETEAPRTLAVVKTWQDLERQPVNRVHGGATVRLGIEATACPQGGGFLVYCLTERYPPSGSMTENRLGPLFVELSRPKNTRPLTREEEERLILLTRGGGFEHHLELPATLSGCRLLFVYPVAVARLGTHGVQVWTRAYAEPSRLLASAEVRGTPEPYHSWVVFKEVKGAGRRPGELDYTVRDGGGGVLPCWPAGRPFVVSGTVEGRRVQRPPEERLPTLVPTTPDPSFQLTVEQDVLTVRLEAGFPTTEPDEYLLARWWVNGRPYVPEEAGSSSLRLVLRPRADRERKKPREIRLRLDPDPGRPWAKSGDRLGLQLLYCESGWQPAAGDRTLNQGQERDAPPRLSNRVEFRAP